MTTLSARLLSALGDSLNPLTGSDLVAIADTRWHGSVYNVLRSEIDAGRLVALHRVRDNVTVYTTAARLAELEAAGMLGPEREPESLIEWCSDEIQLAWKRGEME